MIFKGYAKGKNKQPIQSMSDNALIDYDAAEQFDSFGGKLNDDVIDISFDTKELADKFWDMSEKNNWNCFIQENSENGHLHSFWRIPKSWDFKDGKDKKLAVGLIADIHSKGTYIPIKVNGSMREFIFEPETLDEVPFELFPINTKIDLMNLGEGDGRNDELFRYILILKSQLCIENEKIKNIIHNINEFIFNEPLEIDEINTITRDDAFPEETFFDGKKFLHNNFALFLKNNDHIKRINGQLHVYRDGVYVAGKREIEAQMVKYIPTMKDSQRNEVLKYLEITCPQNTEPADARFIAFNNGIYDITTDKLIDFTLEIVLTNKIPWDFEPNAYSEIADKTLNKLACEDSDIRSLLEECIGYCFFRRNEMSKAFVLTGEGANGKSTYLDMIKNVLGPKNYSALDLDELDERFSVATLSGVLANICDDISDGFLQGKAIANFKKVVSGNQVKAEIKNDPNIFFVKPNAKLLMSANNLPRIRSGGSAAILRRLVIVPFNAKFTKNDADYDPYITYKLKDEEVMKYMIQLGIAGLKRVLENNSFTESKKVEKELENYEVENNPILLFLQEHDAEEFENEPTANIHRLYRIFCSENGYSEMTLQSFSKEMKKRCNFDVKRIRINGKLVGVYTKNE